MGKFMHWWIRRNRTKPVCMSAPTWQAVSVLRRMSPFRNAPNVNYRTVEGVCGFRATRKKKGGDIEFELVPEKIQIGFYALHVMDEASMQNKECFDVVVNHRESAKIIMVGDDGQLPPINEKIAPIYDRKTKSGMTMTATKR